MTVNSVPEMTVFEPGVGTAYGNGWKQLWKNFLELLLAVIIMWVISAPFSVLTWTIGEHFSLNILSSLYAIFVGGPIGYGLAYTFLKAARNEQVEVKDLFAAFQNYWNAVGASILSGIIIAVGVILLIIPGIIFACKLAFVPYLVVDKKMGATEAIRTSWEMTNGYAPDVFLMGLLSIPIMIAGFILFGIGAIPAYMWITAAFASLFHAVDLKKQTVVLPQSPIIGQ